MYKILYKSIVSSCASAYRIPRIKRPGRLKNRLIDWLMVFYAQAAIFQLFSGDEHEMDDKMNMNDDEMKMGWDKRPIRSTTLDCHWKKGGWVGSGNLAFCSGTKPTLFRNLQKGSLTCEERGIFPHTVHHYGLRSGFPYYGLTTPACRMPGVPHSTTWGTHPSCSVGRAPWPLARVLSAI